MVSSVRNVKQSVVLFILLSSLFISCAGILLSSATDAFEKGMGYFNQGNYEEAVPYFQKATELDHNFGRAYLFLGRSYLNLRKWTDAIAPLRTAFRLAPDESRKEILNILIDAFIGAAASEFKKGNFLDSLNYLKEGLSLDPQSLQLKNETINTLISFGGQLLSEGNYKDAVSKFSEAVELSPDNTDALVGVAKASLKNGDLFKAIQTVQKILSIDSENKAANSLFRDILKNK